MIAIGTLESTGLGTLAGAFNLAFSDYEVPMKLTEAQLDALLKRNSYEATISAGLFDEERLVGFILTGRRGNLAYDSGTALIPEYRGKGYAKEMFSFLLPLLKEKGIKEYILEVIQTNSGAIRLYESLGFERKRELKCYRSSRERFAQSSRVLIEDDWSLEELSPLLSYKPSWQNSIPTQSYRAAVIRNSKGKATAYALFSPTGDIAQLAAEDAECTTALLGTVAANTSSDNIRLANIPDAKLQHQLETLGFENFVNQWEMALAL